MLAARRAGLRLPDFGAGEPDLEPLDSGMRSWAEAVGREVDPDRIHADVLGLPAPRNRLHSPEAMERAEELISEKFEEAGWMVERRQFAFTHVAGYLDHVGFGAVDYPRLEGANIVSIKPGEDSEEAMVVLGHYDTIRDSPGANDNTASVAALLELARVLADGRFRRTVILAATDMEELGFFGARALVEELSGERPVRTAINYETMAYTSSEPGTQLVPLGLGMLYRDQVRRISRRQKRGDFTAVIYDGPATRVTFSFGSGLFHLTGEPTPVLLRDPNDLPVLGRFLNRRTVPLVRNFSRSDHVRFWEAGIPAIQITDTANFRYRHYHKPTDTPEKLDYERLAAIVGATAVAVAQEAGLSSSEA